MHDARGSQEFPGTGKNRMRRLLQDGFPIRQRTSNGLEIRPTLARRVIIGPPSVPGLSEKQT
jgi:hypothetical protein